MGATLDPGKPQPARTSLDWFGFPPRMRVLYIASPQRTGAWLAEAFAGDSVAEIVLEEAIGQADGLVRLRDEAYDCVLVSHEPGEMDALDLIEGYRAGGADEPIIVLGTPNEQELAVLCYEVGADGYVCVHTTTTRNLLWIAARGVQRHQLLRDNRRLHQAEQNRLQREHDEADRLLEQQRALLGDLAASRPDESDQGGPRIGGTRPPLALPQSLIAHYRELLRTYVIMGSGNLACELRRLARLLVATGFTARQTMQLHLHVLEELIHGLGARSTRHVMTRADLLVLEVMVHLADGYRAHFREQVFPPRQLRLFE